MLRVAWNQIKKSQQRIDQVLQDLLQTAPCLEGQRLSNMSNSGRSDLFHLIIIHICHNCLIYIVCLLSQIEIDFLSEVHEVKVW